MITFLVSSNLLGTRRISRTLSFLPNRYDARCSSSPRLRRVRFTSELMMLSRSASVADFPRHQIDHHVGIIICIFQATGQRVTQAIVNNDRPSHSSNVRLPIYPRMLVDNPFRHMEITHFRIESPHDSPNVSIQGSCGHQPLTIIQ